MAPGGGEDGVPKSSPDEDILCPNPEAAPEWLCRRRGGAHLRSREAILYPNFCLSRVSSAKLGGPHWCFCHPFSPPRPPPVQYGIVLDAGSSHTAMFVYKWPSDKENETGIVSQHSECHVKGKQNPGAASPAPSLC